MKRIFLLSLVICLPLLATIMSFSPPADANLVNGVLDQTNQFRKSQGLPALIMRNELNAIAQKHSANMASGRVAFGHDGFDKRDLQAKKVISGLHSFAENVAYGATSAKEVVTMWKNSAGHRRNLLGNYKYIGIGTAKDRQGIIYYTEVFAD